MKVILEIEYPNDKIFEADTLPTRIVDLNHGIYFEGDAKIVKAVTIEWIEKWSEKLYQVINGTKYYMGDGYDTVWDMLEDWEKENEIDRCR